MLDKVSELFGNELDFTDNELELFRFGLKSVFCDYLDFFTALIISLFLKDCLNTLFYIVLFAGLRSYCGGYHAKTIVGCLCVYVGVYLMYYFIRTSVNHWIIYSAVSVAGSVYTCIEAPVEHVYAPLLENERIINHRKATVTIVLYMVLATVSAQRFPGFAKTICFVIAVNAISMEVLKHTMYWRRYETEYSDY